MRTPGDEWTTNATRGGMLSGYGFVSRLDDDEQPEQPKPKPRTRRTTRKAAE